MTNFSIMTSFHSTVLLFNTVAVISEAFRFYRELYNKSKNDSDADLKVPFPDWKPELLSKQAFIVLASFLILVANLLLSSDRILIGFMLIILPFFMWSMYRWKDQFQDLWVFLLTK